jgi:hypothetical protein
VDLMVSALWSLKGACGTTAASVALAVLSARRSRGALLVDLVGDVPDLFGLPDPEVPGVAEWLVSGGALDPPGVGWTAPAVQVTDGLAVVPRGRGALRDGRTVEMLSHLLAAEKRDVYVDCGTLGVSGLDGTSDSAGHGLARHADASLLVTRACALAMRRLSTTSLPVTGIVLLQEPGRTIGKTDFERVADAPVIAEVPYDPIVARCIDAGQFSTHLPPALTRAFAFGRERRQ